MNIGVLGIGAIGTVVSLSLKDNNTIYYFNRSQKASLKLQFLNENIQKPISLSIPDNTIILDWLIICLKEYHYKDASNVFKKLINKNTKVAVIRNGINLKEYILPFSRLDNIIECIIDCPTQELKKNHFTQLKKGIITLNRNCNLFNFDSLFNTYNLEFNFSNDFKTYSWIKLIESSALGSILCLSGKTSEIFLDKHILNLFEKITHEGIKVANSDGANISSNFPLLLLDKIKNFPTKKGSSMLTDRLKGNPIEINAKNGIISSLGKKYNINTPVNDIITSLLKHTNT